MTFANAASTPAIRAARAHPVAILSIILFSYFMIVLDNSIVFTGLASIREDLGFTTAGRSWVQNPYVLVVGGLLLLGARAGDILGGSGWLWCAWSSGRQCRTVYCQSLPWDRARRYHG